MSLRYTCELAVLIFEGGGIGREEVIGLIFAYFLAVKRVVGVSEARKECQWSHLAFMIASLEAVESSRYTCRAWALRLRFANRRSCCPLDFSG